MATIGRHRIIGELGAFTDMPRTATVIARSDLVTLRVERDTLMSLAADYPQIGVAVIGDFLYRATEPLLRPIRRILPNFGGLDLSPVVLLIAIWLIRMELENLIFYVYRL